MVKYMDGPDLGALPHRQGKAPSVCKYVELSAVFIFAHYSQSHDNAADTT